MSIAQDQVTRPAVTKSEITRCVRHLFGSGAVHRDAVLAGARAAGARDEVMQRLHLLPAYRYNTAEQVWEHLPKNSVG